MRTDLPTLTYSGSSQGLRLPWFLLVLYEIRVLLTSGRFESSVLDGSTPALAAAALGDSTGSWLLIGLFEELRFLKIGTSRFADRLLSTPGFTNSRLLFLGAPIAFDLELYVCFRRSYTV